MAALSFKIECNYILFEKHLQLTFVFLLKKHKNGKFENSNSGIDLDGSKYCVLPFPPKSFTYNGGAKEVRNFKLKVHCGPEGSRGDDSDNNTDNSHRNHL